jgi:alkylation response protein AidB-like acyl-CoA dehydrogenase
MARFVQPVAPLPDFYAGDPVLRRTLDRCLGEVGHKSAAPLLEALAADCAGPLHEAARDAESHPPLLRQYDAWGRRVDRIETAAGWDVLRRASAEHGLVALPYEREARTTWGAGARVVQLALLHLFGPWSATYSCPVAMSDGAAATLLADGVDPQLRERTVPRLLSRDPATAWTSGQWMTETEGGSDVGRAGTVARRAGDGEWRLTGEKWFCSSTTSEIALALARPQFPGRATESGSRGLATFVVPRYADPDAPGPRLTADGVRIHRLKDKLGTRALPSAEVGLDGALAWPVGDPAEPGLRRMLTLVQVTRIHNAAAAAGAMRRGLMMARSYAEQRVAFGEPLFRQPLHREVLAWLAVDAEAAFTLTALCFSLLGRVEVDADPAAGALLRLAASLAKASTAKLAVASASEYVECFGGPGYIEDTEVPRLLRDAQVLPVWEGTTSVLALDVVRALARDGALTPCLRYVDDVLSQVGGDELAPAAEAIRAARGDVAEQAAAAAADPTSGATQAGARHLLDRMATMLTSCALVEQAVFDLDRGDARSALTARLWVRRRLLGDPSAGEGHRAFAHVVDGAEL